MPSVLKNPSSFSVRTQRKPALRIALPELQKSDPEVLSSVAVHVMQTATYVKVLKCQRYFAYMNSYAADWLGGGMGLEEVREAGRCLPTSEQRVGDIEERAGRQTCR